MTVYLVRRVLQALLVVLAMSLIVFIGVYAIGDPVEILISPDVAAICGVPDQGLAGRFGTVICL
jgi:peptide/nickel transport system permease protein